MLLSVEFYTAGYCQHFEAISIQNGKWRLKKYPAMVALLNHPVFGYYLFDTGYSHHIHQQTRQFPEKLYSWITPITLTSDQTIQAQLRRKGIMSKDIKGIILSHFHADHIAGVKDFEESKVYCSQLGYQTLNKKTPWQALKRGFLPGLLPENISNRMHFIEDFNTISLPPNMQPFEKGYDLFADNSIIAIPLPGHAIGQIGLLCRTKDKQNYFLIADACWDSLSYKELRLPHFITNLITENKQDYRETLQKIHSLHNTNPHLTIVPSHCDSILNHLVTGSE